MEGPQGRSRFQLGQEVKETLRDETDFVDDGPWI